MAANKFMKSASGVLAVTVFVAGCAMPRGGGDMQNAKGSDGGCNAAAIGAIGAVLGAVIGWGNTRNMATGAAIGGALGALACVAINAHSQQTRSAEAVEQDYRRQAGALPPQPTVVRYATAISPSQAIRAGSDVQLRSNIEVVSGRNISVKEIKEELVLINPEGKEFNRLPKVVNENGGAGQYQNTFAFKLPKSAPQGIYTARTLLYVNNRMVSQFDSKVQLVHTPQASVIVVASN
jgi:hypothetical protein